jgi:hypothetical protein
MRFLNFAILCNFSFVSCDFFWIITIYDFQNTFETVIFVFIFVCRINGRTLLKGGRTSIQRARERQKEGSVAAPAGLVRGKGGSKNKFVFALIQSKLEPVNHF